MKYFLKHELRKLDAKRRLNFIWDIASMFGDSIESKSHQIQLVNAAYEDDEESRANLLEGLTRKKA